MVEAGKLVSKGMVLIYGMSGAPEGSVLINSILIIEAVGKWADGCGRREPIIQHLQTEMLRAELHEGEEYIKKLAAFTLSVEEGDYDSRSSTKGFVYEYILTFKLVS